MITFKRNLLCPFFNCRVLFLNSVGIDLHEKLFKIILIYHMQNLGAAPHSLTETRDFRLTLTTSLLRTVSLDWLPVTYKGKGCVCKMLRLKKVPLSDIIQNQE